MRRMTGLAAILVLICGTSEAQELAGTFDQLRVLVKQGDTLTVTDGSGRSARGRLTTLSADSLVLNVSGTVRTFHSTDVDTIESRRPDSLQNGALIGLGLGAGIAGVAIAASVQDGDASTALWVVGGIMYAGIGAGIGAGIDALIEGRRVIYAKSSTARTTLNVAPVLRGRRKGVLVSLQLAR